MIANQTAEQLYRKVSTDALPDEVLLHAFYFYVDQTPNGDAWHELDAWHTLVHVCHKWRCVVFASPKRLNLRLLCNENRLLKNMLDLWPSSLPLVISDSALRRTRLELEGAKIIIAALKHRNRISTIDLSGVLALLPKPFLAMTKPFPELTSLSLHSWDEYIQVLPGSFLSGSCSRLQELHLHGIPFPGLENLLLSTGGLINLRLQLIPHSGYITPEAVINILSTLTKLESFELGFRSPRSLAERASQHSPTVTRVVLTSLTRFQFQGGSAYLEKILSRIDTPLLESFTITFFDCLVLDTPHLRHFISHTEAFSALDRADIVFDSPSDDSHISVTFPPPDAPLSTTDPGVLTLGVRYTDSGPGFMSLVRLFSSSLPPLPTLERLSTRMYRSTTRCRARVTEWVEFLRLFNAVKDLDLSRNGKLTYRIFPALTELAGEGTVGALPALQNVFVHRLWGSDYIAKATKAFVAARQASGRPVAVHYLG